jgi:hypothetical protein
MSMLYVVIVLGITLWLTLVFNTLLGLRVVKLKGVLHGRVHRWIAYALILGGLVHGFLALGTLVFGWFY